MSIQDPARLAELRALAILDTAPESAFDQLAAQAAAALRSQIAAVNFVDERRHHTKAIVGVPQGAGGSVSNDESLCAATVASPEGLLVITDADSDPRWCAHPAVDGVAPVGFYVGAVIHSRGERVGVVCAFGPEPRAVTEAERDSLVALAKQAEAHLRLRDRLVD